MAANDSFLQNDYVLVYKYNTSGKGDETDDAKKTWLVWRFDMIQGMESTLDMGLYTEGTGNLAYSKGATNPVKFIFRKTFDISDAEKAPFSGMRRFEVKGSSTNPDGVKGHNEASIFEWAYAINKGNVDSATTEIYAIKKVEGDDTTATPSLFLTLENAFPVKAEIKRNSFKGTQKAHLSFWADSMKVFKDKDETKPFGAVF